MATRAAVPDTIAGWTIWAGMPQPETRALATWGENPKTLNPYPVSCLQAALHVGVAEGAGEGEDAADAPGAAHVAHQWQLRVWVGALYALPLRLAAAAAGLSMSCQGSMKEVHFAPHCGKLNRQKR